MPSYTPQHDLTPSPNPSYQKKSDPGPPETYPPYRKTNEGDPATQYPQVQPFPPKK